jgi:hypothetical protein
MQRWMALHTSVFFDAHKPLPTSADAAHPMFAWTALGISRPSRGSRHIAFGPGVSRKVKATGNTITLQGILPTSLHGTEQVAVYAEVIAPGKAAPVDRISPRGVQLSGIRSPQVHFSSLTRKDGPFAVAYEPFHYLALPKAEDLSCTVIRSLARQRCVQRGGEERPCTISRSENVERTQPVH